MMIVTLTKVNYVSHAMNLLAKSKIILPHLRRNLFTSKNVIRFYNDDTTPIENQTIFFNQTRCSSQAESDTPNELAYANVNLTILQQILNRPKRYLEKPQSRDILVMSLINISKAVATNRLTVDDFLQSYTYAKLVKQFTLNVDLFSNGQIVNLIASYLKMNVPTSDIIYRLFEHEVKFRLKSLTVAQASKLLHFFQRAEVSSDQAQLVDSLTYQIKEVLCDENVTLKELNTAIRMVGKEKLPIGWESFLQDRLLFVLKETDMVDDVISKMITRIKPYTYESICELIIELSRQKFNAIPILKAASGRLLALPAVNSDESDRNLPSLIISCFGALSTLKFKNPYLIKRLLDDLLTILNWDSLDSVKQCDLLRYMNLLRWRSVDLLDSCICYIKKQVEKGEDIDSLLLLSTIQYMSAVDCPSAEYKSCYKSLKIKLEADISGDPKKWLSYVWCLVNLNMAEKSHKSSVLSEEFYKRLTAFSSNGTLRFSDQMKLFKILSQLSSDDQRQYEHLKHLSQACAQPDVDIQKLPSNIRLSVERARSRPRDTLND